MQILDMTVENYLDDLKTKSPAPGGGSVSGLSAVQGIALTLMVIDLTIGNVRYEEFWNINKKTEEKAKDIYIDLKKAADEDKNAFLKLSQAYKLPRNTEKEKKERGMAIAKESIGATEAPFNIMRLCQKALELTETLIGKSNKMASSDLGVAAVNLLAASKSAWLNVKINIPYLKEEADQKRFIEEGKLMLKSAEEVAERIYSAIEKEL